MKKRAVIALVVAGLLLGGCLNPKNSGEVTDRDRPPRVSRSNQGTLCVRYDGGGTECGRVSDEVYDNCRIGYRWPKCRTTPIP